ncbi:penicillin-binding transpeptidase domain-containing protein [Pseudodesulfovibrio sediminis]|uniref:Penicillin-binding protein n=1 Tax=Pseudodesulfovibrio sediminis TaxID=2810563 RepID=A0ABN6EU07_9BACT|nr:penicillin-binding transpeptidase domain-containing protein [Pseudodesulfovibrio sediminis]BCS88348.1 penicillin-binding protein [Pseudodesulfovibrio sediminis]
MAQDTKGRTDHSTIKIGFVMALFGLALGGLWFRAGWVQIHEGEKLAAKADRQSHVTEYKFGERGRILDRNGQMLATSIESKSVCAHPYKITNVDVAADMLSRELGIRRTTIYKKLKSKRNFVWIKRQVTDRESSAVLKSKLPGVVLTSEYHRIYPNEHLAGQILGFVDIDGKGREGIERIYNDRLKPSEAKFVVQRDRKNGRYTLDISRQDVDINGQDIRLTIDIQIQHAAEQALAKSIAKYDARSGIVLVVDVSTGDILAMANQPFFNPNTVRSSKAYQRRLRALTDSYEPGSTLKPILFAAALEEKVIEPDTLINCENGRWHVARRLIRDTHPEQWLPANKVLRYSSNIGSAKIGMELGAERYYSYLAKLGFGEKTNIGLPGESSGIMRPAARWTSVDLAAISFGQGIGATALQMAKAFLCIANQGATRELNLVKSPKAERKNVSVQVFSPETTAKVLSMMKDVVHEDGTGRSARIEGITMAGKTGTAQKASPKGGYGDQYLSSFVALVPADNPELMVITMIDEPQKANYGSMVAAPVCREVTVRTLAYHGKLSETLVADDAEIVPMDEIVESAKSDIGPAQVQAVIDTDRVPNIAGMPVRRALEVLVKMGIVPVLKGTGMTVKRQKPAAGTPWPEDQTSEGEDDVFILWLS